MNASKRRGFALLLVLWMLVGVAAISVGLVSAGRYSLLSTTNRVLLSRGVWAAEGCIERARAAIDDTLLAPAVLGNAAWQSLDTVVGASPLMTGCDLDVHPAGVALDVNMASNEQLSLAIQSSGAGPERSDSIADAIIDWRRVNGPIAASDELLRVPGVISVPAIRTLFDVEPGRILVGRAPASVLAALPGFGSEAVARAMSLSGESPRDLLAFSALLSPPARAELMAHAAELQNAVTFVPDAWIVVARAQAGSPPVVSEIEVRVVRAGTRAAIVRRRSWP